jgi:hypothetical protein
MKTAAQKKLFQTFETSSKDNGIVMFKEKLQQARRSGSSYRCQKEAKERVELSYRFSDDLMRPYQDTYRNQIPAILLAMCDKGALTKVILKKLKLAESEQRLARYLLESQGKGEKWLMGKWAEFVKGMTEEEIEYYTNWLETFSGPDEEDQPELPL